MASRAFVPPKVRGYEFVEILGEGDWGKTLTYRDVNTGGIQPFKFMKNTPLTRDRAGYRGLSEADILRKEALGGFTRALPGVAYVSTGYADDGTPFLRVEPVETTLRTYLDFNPDISLEEIFRISRGIATGLKSMHTRIVNEVDGEQVVGRAHGDLSLGNIGYNVADGEVKLIDFGTSS